MTAELMLDVVQTRQHDRRHAAARDSLARTLARCDTCAPNADSLQRTARGAIVVGRDG